MPKVATGAPPQGQPARQAGRQLARSVWFALIGAEGELPVRTGCPIEICPVVSFLSNPTIRAFYQRPLGTGKAKKLALTAAMRKLLVILNAMLRNATPWRTANPA